MNERAPDGYDAYFYWDPICPFAWITSRWVEKVAAQKGYAVDYRFISLRILNKEKDYATEFPPDYPRLHGAGLKMLRVAAAVRADHGREAMAGLYTAFGNVIWDQPPDADVMATVGESSMVESVLDSAGIDVAFAAHVDNESWDGEIEAETDEAVSHTGRDVGTPIVAFQPPDGPAFFGPVISRIPTDDEAVPLWDAVMALAKFPGFAELKRSLREFPQLQALGWTPGDAVEEQDWQGGSLRQE